MPVRHVVHGRRRRRSPSASARACRSALHPPALQRRPGRARHPDPRARRRLHADLPAGRLPLGVRRADVALQQVRRDHACGGRRPRRGPPRDAGPGPAGPAAGGRAAGAPPGARRGGPELAAGAHAQRPGATRRRRARPTQPVPPPYGGAGRGGHPGQRVLPRPLQRGRQLQHARRAPRARAPRHVVDPLLVGARPLGPGARGRRRPGRGHPAVARGVRDVALRDGQRPPAGVVHQAARPGVHRDHARLPLQGDGPRVVGEGRLPVRPDQQLRPAGSRLGLLRVAGDVRHTAAPEGVPGACRRDGRGARDRLPAQRRPAVRRGAGDPRAGPQGPGHRRRPEGRDLRPHLPRLPVRRRHGRRTDRLLRRRACARATSGRATRCWCAGTPSTRGPADATRAAASSSTSPTTPRSTT